MLEALKNELATVTLAVKKKGKSPALVEVANHSLVFGEMQSEHQREREQARNP